MKAHARALAVVVVVAAATSAVAPAAYSTGAADAEEAPALSVAGPETLIIELQRSAAGLQGSVELVVLNTGGLVASTQVTGVQLDDPPGSCDAEIVGPEPVDVPPDDDARLPVTLSTAPSCADESGTLLLESVPAGDPVAVRFTFARSDTEFAYFTPVGVAVALALLFAASLLGKVRREGQPPNIDLGAAFSFKDSWLTTVSTFTAVVGAVLTTTGVVTSVLPGLDVSKLLTLNLVFGGFVLAAPVVYAALAVWEWRLDTKTGGQNLHPSATPWGLLAASATTVVGVVGQLATVWILVQAAALGSFAKVAVLVSLVAVVLFVLAYARRWTAAALARPADQPPQVGVSGSGTL